MAVAHLKRNVIIPGAIATTLYGLKLAATHLYQTYALPRLYSYITIDRAEEAEYFDAVLDLIQEMLPTNHLVVCSRRMPNQQITPADDTFLDPIVHYQPAETNAPASIVYRGRRIFVSRQSGQTLIVGPQRNMLKMETLTLSVFGSDPAAIKDLIADAIEQVNERKTGLVRILVQNNWQRTWIWVLSKKPRSLDTVALSEDAAHCIDDARAFLESKHWYEQMGIPYRRGYLLHGPPGCGKTSFCHVLASALQLDVCTMSLASKDIDDQGLVGMMRDAPLRSVIMLEDVDAVFTKRDNTDRGSNVTFSGLINAIDGVASQEGRILIMTTNHAEKLDPALLRPGRCDVKILFDRASREQLRAMYLRFFPGCEDRAARFADSLPARGLSLAQVQNYLVSHRHSAERAEEEAGDLNPKTTDGYH
jgi:chaperone BCS1